MYVGKPPSLHNNGMSCWRYFVLCMTVNLHLQHLPFLMRGFRSVILRTCLLIFARDNFTTLFIVDHDSYDNYDMISHTAIPHGRGRTTAPSSASCSMCTRDIVASSMSGDSLGQRDLGSMRAAAVRHYSRTVLGLLFSTLVDHHGRCLLSGVSCRYTWRTSP